MPSRSTDDHQSTAAAEAEAAVAAAALSSSLKRKEDGNRFFSMKRYSVAIACYRSGLEELKNIDRSSLSSSNNNNNDDEIVNLEISLRSNIALALLKLANPQSIQEYNQPGVATNDITKRKYCMEVTSECTAALELDNRVNNAKLFHRRGQARQLLAELDDNNIDNDDDDGISKQWTLAEEDFSQSVQLLQQQLKDGSNQNDNNACRKQLADANRALEKLRVTMKENQMKRSDNESRTSGESQQQQQQQSSTLSTATDCENEADDDVTNTDVPPSPETQREYILELLSRCANTPTPPAKRGEAYFLINMEWWQSWCCYVGLFSLYTDTTTTAVATTTGEGGNNMGRMEIKRHCKTIDMANLQLLKLLPPGATLPPYYEQNRNEALTSVDDEKGEEDKKKKKNQSRGRSDDSSYTSSEEDSDDDESKIEEGTLFPSPGVIDNSSLILPRNNEGWCCPIEYASDQEEDEKSPGEESPSWALLKNHLVRGYHFELLPREAYVALRSWYGESSPHIIRRVEDVDGNVQVIQYPEQWDAVSRCVNELPGTKCSACGSPTGTKTCTKCGVAHYCNRNCQVNHWSYHKKICQTLKIQRQEQQQQGGRLGAGNDLLDYSRWGRVGLNNLGNTCFLNSAMQVSRHIYPSCCSCTIIIISQTQTISSCFIV